MDPFRFKLEVAAASMPGPRLNAYAKSGSTSSVVHIKVGDSSGRNPLPSSYHPNLAVSEVAGDVIPKHLRVQGTNAKIVVDLPATLIRSDVVEVDTNTWLSCNNFAESSPRCTRARSGLDQTRRKVKIPLDLPYQLIEVVRLLSAAAGDSAGKMKRFDVMVVSENPDNDKYVA